ncbi:glycosyl hydrolase 115 family protein [Nafulsella turpanensis]|uniref:glycosyl hydrolase 115 family protein n=1 Tax=Nafulsella turpanensis TaxID=1265690 RepID=UPI00034A1D05|nr:glycosyl hydrolase 115 family protein [Nafulsella turpanensis]
MIASLSNVSLKRVAGWQPIRTALCLLLLIVLAGLSAVRAQAVPSYIAAKDGEGRFPLSASGKAVPLYISNEAEPGVIRALKDLQADIGKVSGAQPELLLSEKAPKAQEVVLVGTLGKSPLIDQLVKQKKLDVSGIAGKWETFLIQVVEKPMRGVDRALVIAGSDKRGTIFGIYDVAEHIGVSPWYWWADVPVKQQENLYVLPGRHTIGEPAVKYRGIFINDEAPALSGWAFEKFGGFNSKFYAKVFELILRMKGNYLWPAMWGRQFYVEDPLNPEMANDYGVVIGTSHHEPMMRAHAEWEHFGEGPWNYKTNKENLQKFWREGIERMGDNESLVTIGMRGDGDEPMTEGTEIALLERIVDDQREIIEEVTGKPAAETPQVWALYKEVQDYYDKGMRVPDDVTLLLADDNWGNIRKLPALGDTLRSGGYGIYYHFDYVGGPRNYKWINTNPIARVWEQMHLAYQYGADQIWIVNVGDIKPMEFPTEFFLDYAWNPEKWPAESLPAYTRQWVGQQFGTHHTEAIARILTTYLKYNGRRKPELLSPETYSLTSYREAERVVAEYNQLVEKAEEIYRELPEEYKDAYYQLILFPVKASANLNELYVTVAKNRLYARQGRAATNKLAEKARELFEKDAALTHYFHTELADGKWNHMMAQTHIGYTYWQQPEENTMPEVKKIEVPASASMGVMVEGSEAWWPHAAGVAELPELTPYQPEGRYLEVFNRGKEAFPYTVSTGEPWLQVKPAEGKIDKEQRLWVQVDWEKVPNGLHRVPLTVHGPNNQQVIVEVIVRNPASPELTEVEGFVESNGYVSMEAAHFTRAIGNKEVSWQVIPDLGKTLSAVTPLPGTAPDQVPGGGSPHLEYKMYLFDTGTVEVKAYLSPTLNLHNDQGLRYAVSFDDEEPQIINLHTDDSEQNWNKEVADNIKVLSSSHYIKEPGEHVLKFWMVDPAVVLQKLVVETEKQEDSYLGPPESFYRAPGSKNRK